METKAGNKENSLEISYYPLDNLKPYSGNARKHSKNQIREIADSIQAFGFNNPVLIDKDHTIIAGHGRWEAARLLGLGELPVVRLDHLSKAQKKAYVLADNRLAEKAGWDKDILAVEFQDLLKLDPEFDLTITGFKTPEIDILIDEAMDLDEAEEDELVAPPKTAVTRTSDLWLLGDHRIYCGDSLAEDSYKTLMDGRQANLVFTDPPYNVPIKGHVSGKGKIKHEEFAMASGEMSPAQFTAFLQKVLGCTAKHSVMGSLHYICMDWRHITEITNAAKNVYGDLKNLCIWNKDRGGMGSLYRSKHELVFVYRNGTVSHTNNIELGKHGRNRTNVWDYPAVNSRKTGPTSELAMHPTVKPVKMIADAILDCSRIGDLVLDPFGGSGSTLMAAARTNRKACLIELSPSYVDVAIQRWQRKTKTEAVHSATGKTYSELENERGL